MTSSPPPTTVHIPLSVFDKVTFDTHVALIYAYRPLNPPNITLELGLQKALSVYRERAGRYGEEDNGCPVILLNDESMRFVEASVDSTLDQAMPLKPLKSLLSLHPSLKGVVDLVQVQLTRFTCGSLVLGFTTHHHVADGHSTSNCVVAWGLACRGIHISPLPLQDRTIFSPRNPPRFEFDHRGVKFMNKKLDKIYPLDDNFMDRDQDIVVHKVHFTLQFLAKLKARASSMNGANKPYSTFESLVVHLWKGMCLKRVRNHPHKNRSQWRLNPRVPNEYFCCDRAAIMVNSKESNN
ncbi:unnamed protein product [Ilex paraguariensis]|uniref:Agmatine coumaroyltransferase-2-like n=1 Tax=Ilex paraguariensis TaxID=185542 RepID=A0ABC8S0T5_9AQUA